MLTYDLKATKNFEWHGRFFFFPGTAKTYVSDFNEILKLFTTWCILDVGVEICLFSCIYVYTFVYVRACVYAYGCLYVCLCNL